MKATTIILIVIVLILIAGSIPVNAAITPPEVVNLPYKTEIIDDDRDNVINLSTALVGTSEIPLISYVLTSSRYLIWMHLATSAVSGNTGPENRWKLVTDFLVIPNPGSLSNVATEIYGPDTFGLAWAYDASNGVITGFGREVRHDMTPIGISAENLLDISNFGDAVVGAPSLELIGSHYRMAVVIRDDQGDFTFYKLIYMHYVGGNNTSCYSFLPGYKCDEIDISIGTPLSSPSLAYAGGDIGIAYTKGNAVHYAYPWNGGFPRASNCGPGGDTWRCITIDEPGIGTVGERVALAYGSDDTHAAIVYSTRPTTKDIVMRATYKGSGGNCGQDGTTLGMEPIYRWDCSDVDAFIEDINETTFAVTFDPNDFPVISWNNKFIGDEAQRLYVAYPGARAGIGGGWHKQVVDGNDWSVTGKWNDISINSSGLTFLGYIQPEFQGCDGCVIDNTPNLKATMQWFTISLPIVMK